MNFLGIDPGASGGLALLDGEGKVLDLTPMPAGEDDLWWWLTRLPGGWPRKEGLWAVIEQVGGYQRPAPGGRPFDTGASMFRFGQGYGTLRGMLVALGLSFTLRGFTNGAGSKPTAKTLAPRTWQKMAGCVRVKGEEDGPWKRRLKARACELFPDLAGGGKGKGITLKTADALLIAWCCRELVVSGRWKG